MSRLSRFFYLLVCALFTLLVTGCAGTPASGNGTAPTLSSVQQNAFLYVGNRDSNNVSGFNINSDGTLAPLGNSPFSIPWAISASGRQLFASGNGTVSAFNVDATLGSLTHLSDTTVPGGGRVLATDGVNTYVNGLDQAGNFAIYGFTNAANGQLIPLSGSPYFCGDGTDFCDQPVAMAIHKKVLMVGGSDGHDFTGNVTTYPRIPGGTLEPRKNAGSGVTPSIAIHPDGKLAYAVDETRGQGLLLQLLIAPDGTITGEMSFYQINLDGSYIAVAIDPTGKYLVILEETPAHISRLKVFTIDETKGDLTFVGAPVETGGIGGNFLAFGPSGNTVYVVHGGGTTPSNDLSVFSFDHNTGSLTKIQSVASGGIAPQNLTVALP